MRVARVSGGAGEPLHVPVPLPGAGNRWTEKLAGPVSCPSERRAEEISSRTGWPSSRSTAGSASAGAFHIRANGIDVEHHLAGALVDAGAHQAGKVRADGGHVGGDLFEGLGKRGLGAGEELDAQAVAAAADPPVGHRSRNPSGAPRGGNRRRSPGRSRPAGRRTRAGASRQAGTDTSCSRNRRAASASLIWHLPRATSAASG